MPRQWAWVLPLLEKTEPCWKAFWKKQAKQLCLWGEPVVAAGQVHSHTGQFNAHFLLVKGYLFSVWILSCFRLSLVRTKPEQLLLCLPRDIPKLFFTGAVLQGNVPVGSAWTISRFVPLKRWKPSPPLSWKYNFLLKNDSKRPFYISGFPSGWEKSFLLTCFSFLSTLFSASARALSITFCWVRLLVLLSQIPNG